ncbi:hypothetical protein H2199_002172 [Coniosporium tulheliwenetii]|uniref:Uncharacterized protein n=1 Tax=Coniosporium tulheliwenetii TaxID=3383036 RepID=A0ACC2ZI27_9PEZI|nr:hypothetical protein H2199_002172 [Cladosporium sp. JES 115]
MATLAHCAYCFEILSASIEKRQPLHLKQVEELWDKYNAPSDEDEAEHHDDDDDDEDEDEDMEEVPAPEQRTTTSLRPAAISRLLAPSPRSSSSSSVPSTASSVSVNGTSSSAATSKSSSRSSFFSTLGRRSKPTESPSSYADYPLFVTWNTVSRSGHKLLRGCIGTFEGQKLDDGLRSYALTSASRTPSLECGVTLLHTFTPIASPLAWDIGIHGLRISFVYHSRRYGATYLPDVPKEQGWTKEETIVSLMRKAGWTGRREDWRKVGDLQVVTYMGKKVTIGYAEWRAWKQWTQGGEASVALN